MTENIIIVIVSFFCSIGFAVVFGIRPRELLLAGLGGALTRAVLLVFMTLTPSRLLFTFLASVVGTLYAHILARVKNFPITKFMYPALIPIIPGDLLYYTMTSLVSNSPDVGANALSLFRALLGLAAGTMLVPIVMNSRKYFRRLTGTSED